VSLVLIKQQGKRFRQAGATCDDGARWTARNTIGWLHIRCTTNDAPACATKRPELRFPSKSTAPTGLETLSVAEVSTHASSILQLLHTILASCSVYSLPEHDCRDFLVTTSLHIYLSHMSLAPFITQLGAEIEDASEGDCLESKPLVSSSAW
jgi:hypothetical protein